MSTFTPGPWLAHKSDDLHGHDHFVMTPNGFLGYMPKDSEGGGMQLFTGEDARLIAAAPELLEALMEFVNPFDGIEVVQGGLIGKARAAIAKATGQ